MYDRIETDKNYSSWIFLLFYICTCVLSGKLDVLGLLKFIYSEKATKFCEIFPLLLTVCTAVKSKGEDFAKFCGLLRIYEL